MEFLPFLDDNTFHHVRQCVELVFNFLGVDVLPVGTEKHVFAAPANVEIALLIQHAEVTCVVPSLVVQRGSGGFRVFVVTEHYVRAASEDFAYDVLRIGAVDAQFHAGSHFSTRTRNETAPIFVGDDGGAFCGTVAHGVIEVDFVQELLHFLVERRSADNDLVEFAAEHRLNLIAHLVQNLVADHRDAQK